MSRKPEELSLKKQNRIQISSMFLTILTHESQALTIFKVFSYILNHFVTITPLWEKADAIIILEILFQLCELPNITQQIMNRTEPRIYISWLYLVLFPSDLTAFRCKREQFLQLRQHSLHVFFSSGKICHNFRKHKPCLVMLSLAIA